MPVVLVSNNRWLICLLFLVVYDLNLVFLTINIDSSTQVFKKIIIYKIQVSTSAPNVFIYLSVSSLLIGAVFAFKWCLTFSSTIKTSLLRAIFRKSFFCSIRLCEYKIHTTCICCPWCRWSTALTRVLRPRACSKP